MDRSPCSTRHISISEAAGLVAADPDSHSGKARKARDYGLPVVTEDGFTRMLTGMQVQAR